MATGGTAPTSSRSRRLAAAGTLAAVLLLGACGGGDTEEAVDDSEQVDTEATDEAERTTTTTAPAGGPCTVEALTEAAVVDYPGTTVSRESCSAGRAIALLSGDAANGESVAFFAGDDGTWVILSIGAVDAATADSLPEGFPKLLFTRWLSAKQKADNPSAGSGGVVVGGGDGADERTPEDGLDIVEPTTTTTAPPTTLPPVTEPPTTVERQIDPFCVEFPEDPTCIEDPYLPVP